MKRGIVCLCIIFLAASLLFAVSVHAQSPQDILAQYVSDLQKNPGDFALREKIIKHVQTMSPAPSIPEEARRHYVMGRTLLKDAKSPQEANEAAGEFRKALAVAPWYPEANRFCGVALGIANRHDEAIVMLKLYIATNPPDARDAQDEIYAMEAKKIKAASDKAASVARAADEARAKAEAEAKHQNEYQAWLKKLDGARYVNRTGAWTYTFTIRGNEVVEVAILGPNDLDAPGPRNRGAATIDGRRFIQPGKYLSGDGHHYTDRVCLIREDGNAISCEGGGPALVYQRER